MTWRRFTALAIIGLFILGAGYDLLAYRFGGDEATISVTVLHTADTYPLFIPLFVFPFGALFGHLFSPPRTMPTWTRWAALGVVAASLLGALYELVAYRFGVTGLAGACGRPDSCPLFIVFAALAAGALFASVFLTQHPPDAPAPGG